MNQYEVFGLQVASEITLNDVPLGRGATDVFIRIRPLHVPTHVTFRHSLYAIHERLFYLDIPEVGRFQVENGDTITIDPLPGATTEQIKLYVLGSCFGCLLHQRQVVPLHGSVLDLDGQGVLVTGVSGAGKSTIANALIERGYTFVTDDVAAITFHKTIPYVQLAYPSQKLWEDVMTRWGMEGTKAITRQTEGRTKFAVVRNQSFAKQAVPLRFVFEVCPVQNRTDVRMKPVVGIDKVKTLLVHTYRNELIAHLRPHASYLQQIMQLAEQTYIYRIERPVALPLEQHICEIILEQIQLKV